MSWCGLTKKACTWPTYSILQNEHDAEDAAQDAMLKALKNLRNFRAESKFSTWLISIAINEARGRLRHARVLKFESLDAPPEDDDGAPHPGGNQRLARGAARALERKELRQMLRQPSPACRKSIARRVLLRDVEEFSIAETAAALGVSEGVVKTRLLRARLMMQKMLAPQLASKRSGLFGLFRSKAGGSWF